MLTKHLGCTPLHYVPKRRRKAPYANLIYIYIYIYIYISLDAKMMKYANDLALGAKISALLDALDT